MFSDDLNKTLWMFLLLLAVIIGCYSDYLKQAVDMSSASKKLQPKRSLIKLLDKENRQARPAGNEDKFKTISTEKERKKSCLNSASKTKRSKDEMKDLLKESYMFVKEENQSLANKLRRKMRRIEEMKEVMQGQEDKIKEYEEVISILKLERGRSKSKPAEESLKGSRKYEDMVKEAQEIAKISLEKFKRVERQMEDQRNRYEREIGKLREDNQALKQQIFRVKLQHSEAITSKKKMKPQPKSIQKENRQDLANEVKVLKEKEQNWIIKQQELKRMLNQINSKINNFEVTCLLTQQKAKKYKSELDHLQQKYEAKCRKNRELNQKWHSIFKDFMKETQSMGKDIESVKKLFMDILKECLHKYDKS